VEVAFCACTCMGLFPSLADHQGKFLSLSLSLIAYF
jgi:hypothetical protein